MSDIAATVHYISDTSVRPEIWNEDFTRNILPLTATQVRIEDLSRSSRQPELDTHGFALVSHRSSVVDAPDIEINPTYRSELHALLQRVTGAHQINVGDFGFVRRSHVEQSAAAPNIPIAFVHSDTTKEFVPALIKRSYPAAARPVRRTAIFNLWRLLSPSPTTVPLALCDARSVSAQDLVPGWSHFLNHDFTAEAVFVRANRDHRWSYFRDMRAEQLLIFKQYDSDDRFPTYVPHTTLEDHSDPHTPRSSIEYRALARWFSD